MVNVVDDTSGFLSLKRDRKRLSPILCTIMYTKRETVINTGLRIASEWTDAASGDTFQPLNQTDDWAPRYPGRGGDRRYECAIAECRGHQVQRQRSNSKTPNLLHLDQEQQHAT